MPSERDATSKQRGIMTSTPYCSAELGAQLPRIEEQLRTFVRVTTTPYPVGQTAQRSGLDT